MTARAAGTPKQTEDQFQRAVIEYAQLLGYRVAHFRPGVTFKGWRTAVSADGAGFPDLVIAGHGRLIFAELKSASGKVSAEQQEWIEELRRCGQRAVVWRPACWESIVQELAP